MPSPYAILGAMDALRRAREREEQARQSMAHLGLIGDSKPGARDGWDRPFDAGLGKFTDLGGWDRPFDAGAGKQGSAYWDYTPAGLNAVHGVGAGKGGQMFNDPGMNMMSQMRMPRGRNMMDMPENQINMTVPPWQMPQGYERMTQGYTPEQIFDMQNYGG